MFLQDFLKASPARTLGVANSLTEWDREPLCDPPVRPARTDYGELSRADPRPPWRPSFCSRFTAKVSRLGGAAVGCFEIDRYRLLDRQRQRHGRQR